jgi:hypothetical protein
MQTLPPQSREALVGQPHWSVLELQTLSPSQPLESQQAPARLAMQRPS